MGKNTSISLGDHFENFIEYTVVNGQFKNASEVLRARLRLPEEEENRISLLKEKIQKGFDSGRAKDFDPVKHLALLKASRASKI